MLTTFSLVLFNLCLFCLIVLNYDLLVNYKVGQNPTCSPSGMRKGDCAFLAYPKTGYATAT